MEWHRGGCRVMNEVIISLKLLTTALEPPPPSHRPHPCSAPHWPSSLSPLRVSALAVLLSGMLFSKFQLYFPIVTYQCPWKALPASLDPASPGSPPGPAWFPCAISSRVEMRLRLLGPQSHPAWYIGMYLGDPCGARGPHSGCASATTGALGFALGSARQRGGALCPKWFLFP